MKKFVFLFCLMAALQSCWKIDKPTPPRLLPKGVFMEERVPVYDSVNVWSVEQKQYVKVWGIARYNVVPIREYEVVPNGKQIMKYSNASGYGKTKYIGWSIVIAVIALIWWASGQYFSLDKGTAKAVTRGVAIITAIGIALLTITPANIARNNAKPITEKQLRHYEAIDPELNYFWDSVFTKGALIKN